VSGPPESGGARTGDTVAIPGDYQARALHEGFVVQRFWHALKFKVIERVCPPRPGGCVLDVGCGSGVVANYLAGKAGFVDALDGNPAAIEFGQSHATGPNMAFHLSLIDAMPFEPGRFDQIYCMELIEHIYEHQVRALLPRLRELLKPGGELFVTTPNYASLWPVIEWAMDVLHLAPPLKEHQHVSRWTPGRLRALGDASGLEALRIGRFSGFAPFTSVLSWKLAEGLDRCETGLGNPLGNLLFGHWRRR
jgi:2-polyprenyl-3-methyl-5-hydroxy-6-metoxy-1,4-benzoquinol methylase